MSTCYNLEVVFILTKKFMGAYITILFYIVLKLILLVLNKKNSNIAYCYPMFTPRTNAPQLMNPVW